jgi:hypothetical protein
MDGPPPIQGTMMVLHTRRNPICPVIWTKGEINLRVKIAPQCITGVVQHRFCTLLNDTVDHNTAIVIVVLYTVSLEFSFCIDYLNHERAANRM